MATRKQRRLIVFAVSWLAYVAFYLCRRNFSVIMPLLSTQNGFTTASLGQIVFAFGVAYTVGQFLMGFLADLLGARLTVPAGMAISALAVATMGFHSSFAWLFTLQVVNGLAQATGWSGLSRIFRTSFPRENRGVTMGWWTTNYAVGALLATILASWAATARWFPELGWRRAAWAPAIVLFAMALLFHFFSGPRGLAEEAPPRQRRSYLARILRNNSIRPLAAAYLLVKFIRYSLMFWLPLFLMQYDRFAISSASYISGLFDFAGIAGVLAAGYLSDRVFSARRFPVISLMLLALAAVSLLPALHASGTWATALEVSLLGFMTYGPDTLLVGAATQDASTESEAGGTAGIVDGFGSIGQLASPLIVSGIVEYWGWPAVFLALSFAAFAAAALLGSIRRMEAAPDEITITAAVPAFIQSK